MNPYDVLPQVQKAIKTSPGNNMSAVNLCYGDEKIRCCLLGNTPTTYHVFCQLTATQCREGLSTQKWDSLANQITKYFTDNFLCPKHPKH